MKDKPTVLVINGLPQGHREVVRFLVQKVECSTVRVVDSSLPALSGLTVEDAEVFTKVDFVQANVTNPAVWPRVFTRKAVEGREEETHWDYVFCLQLIQKVGRSKEAYEMSMHGVAMACAKECIKYKSGIFVYLSMAGVTYANKSSGPAATEETPFRTHGYGAIEWAARTDRALQELVGLNALILRSALPWGPNGVFGVANFLTVGKVYRQLQEPLVHIYGAGVGLSSVHIDDVVGGMWHAAHWYRREKKQGAVVFNIAAPEKTTHGSIMKQIAELFEIEVEFQGALKLKVMAMALRIGMVRDEVNEKHMDPWTRMLQVSDITYCPLSPYMDEEYLMMGEISVDGSALGRKTGFTYAWPEITLEGLRAQVGSYEAAGVWPRDLLPGEMESEMHCSKEGASDWS